MLKKRNQKGFTIIEVLIVLAIAALIMLVVFLAVPALRRNAANSGRANDAAKVSAAVTDCLTNHNGLATACADVGPSKVDVTDFAQLTDTITSANFINPGAAGTPALLLAATDKDASTFVVSYKVKCSTAGDGLAIVSTNNRDFVVQYNKKTSSGVAGSNVVLQCIGS
jgi:prepilin-type N-terminal cleavage/methylation domain-containing protein